MVDSIVIDETVEIQAPLFLAGIPTNPSSPLWVVITITVIAQVRFAIFVFSAEFEWISSGGVSGSLDSALRSRSHK